MDAEKKPRVYIVKNMWWEGNDLFIETELQTMRLTGVTIQNVFPPGQTTWKDEQGNVIVMEFPLTYSPIILDKNK